MVLLQADLYEGSVLRRVAGVHRREVRRDADIRNDHAEILRGNHATDEILDPADLFFGDFEARARRELSN